MTSNTSNLQIEVNLTLTTKQQTILQMQTTKQSSDELSSKLAKTNTPQKYLMKVSLKNISNRMILSQFRSGEWQSKSRESILNQANLKAGNPPMLCLIQLGGRNSNLISFCLRLGSTHNHDWFPSLKDCTKCEFRSRSRNQFMTSYCSQARYLCKRTIKVYRKLSQ